MMESRLYNTASGEITHRSMLYEILGMHLVVPERDTLVATSFHYHTIQQGFTCHFLLLPYCTPFSRSSESSLPSSSTRIYHSSLNNRCRTAQSIIISTSVGFRSAEIHSSRSFRTYRIAPATVSTLSYTVNLYRQLSNRTNK